MIVYILTSDKNNWLLKGMQYCIKKYWPDHPTIKILGYKPLDFELQKNFEFISLGKDNGPEHVNKDLFEFFSKIEDENFIFTVDDFFPIRNINTELLTEYEKILSTGEVSRIALNGHVKNKPFTVYKRLENFDIVEVSQFADYRKSAIWSIWNKNYFTKYLASTDNLWDWELDDRCKFDGHVVLGSDRSYAIQACHLIKRGEIKAEWYKDSESSDEMFPEDIDKINLLINA